MAYNPYFNPYGQQPMDINAMQNQLTQIQQMRNQIQSPIPNNQPQPNGVIQIGTYVTVETIQDMENYPAPINGDPINIFIKGQGVFYSKKMINGGTSCQPFSFSPLNNTANVDNKQDIQNSVENVPLWAKSLIDKINLLENKVNGSNVTKTGSKQNSKKEVEDGI